MTNEAAEQLRRMTRIAWVGDPAKLETMWRSAIGHERKEARAAEHKATVERIRAAAYAAHRPNIDDFIAILDAEVER